MKGSFLFLGTGASVGVPIIGCSCAVCHSLNPKNTRLRPAGLIRLGEKRFLIDIGPDFRQQALRHHIDKLDGILLTHTHYDHIAGIDEIRILNFRQKKAIPILLSQESYADLSKRYFYLFQEKKDNRSHAAEIDCVLLPSDEGEIVFADLPIRYTSYSQGGMKVNGFRIGNFAYISDIREYREEIYAFLDGVDQLVLSALRQEASAVHFSLEEAVQFAKKAKIKQTWLTHLSHAVEHEAMCKLLPPFVQPGFDGQEFFINA